MKAARQRVLSTVTHVTVVLLIDVARARDGDKPSWCHKRHSKLWSSFWPVAVNVSVQLESTKASSVAFALRYETPRFELL